jgi:hypothetical protein
MRDVGPGIVSPDMVSAIRTDLLSLVGDDQVSVAITLTQKAGAPSINYAAGTLTENVLTRTVTALRCEVSVREVQSSAGGLSLGDVRFHVMREDLDFSPSVGDTFTSEGVRWRVLATSSDPLTLLNTYTARRA